MYRKMEKEAFIEDYMSQRTAILTSMRSLFKKTEPFEKRNQKDCSLFSVEEALEMYNKFEAKSVDVLMNYNTILRAYSRWQESVNNVDLVHTYEQINQDHLMALVPEESRKLLSRKDIDDIEEQLLNWTDKAIVECLWEGIAGNSMSDLISLSEDMLDREKKQLRFPDGRTVDLTEKLIRFLSQAFSETEYLCYGPSRRLKQLNGYGCLYKERDNAHAADSDDKFFRWVYRKIDNFRKHVGIKKFTMKNLSTSGMYHYLCVGMAETGLDMKSYLKTDNGSELMSKYGYGESDARVDNVLHRYKQFLV